MPASILWIAALSGLALLGGAHLLVWLFVRSQRKAETRSHDETAP